jgi:hypothetical protein
VPPQLTHYAASCSHRPPVSAVSARVISKVAHPAPSLDAACPTGQLDCQGRQHRHHRQHRCMTSPCSPYAPPARPPRRRPLCAASVRVLLPVRFTCPLAALPASVSSRRLHITAPTTITTRAHPQHLLVLSRHCGVPEALRFRPARRVGSIEERPGSSAQRGAKATKRSTPQTHVVAFLQHPVPLNQELVIVRASRAASRRCPLPTCRDCAPRGKCLSRDSARRRTCEQPAMHQLC